MEKVLRNRDKELKVIGDSVDIGDMILKLDEIVEWINERDAKTIFTEGKK